MNSRTVRAVAAQVQGLLQTALRAFILVDFVQTPSLLIYAATRITGAADQVGSISLSLSLSPASMLIDFIQVKQTLRSYKDRV